MDIRIHGGELNRMMRIITQCIDPRDTDGKANICITHEDNKLTVRATNGMVQAEMYTSVLGGEGESICVDGTMFARICAMCSGEISISSNDKTCTIKGNGRTRIPVVNAKIPVYESISGDSLTVTGGAFTSCYGRVAYAVATDPTRIILTGVLNKTDGKTLKMVSLDGFQMSVEETECEGDAMKIVIPGMFMKLVSSAVCTDDKVVLTTDGHAVQAEAEGMRMRCTLLAGDYIDYDKILPKEFSIKSRINVQALTDALKASNVVNNKQNLVKLYVGNDTVTVQNNSEQADFEAVVPCETQGDLLKIAFNQKYLLNTINAIDTDDAELNFNTATSPVVVKSMNGKGTRLVLPVRVMG